MGTLLDLLGSIGTLVISSMKDVTEEEIEKNIEFLKKYQWFQDYLDNEEYKHLIHENNNVRNTIGKLDTYKMVKNSYQQKWRRKIFKSLLKNLR
ncbi:hypothetical protein [Oceanobacillus senegalensis]|uniref:hypothetical protein n=1 Tax=Oceanobacillus senegalensis TaxID=1936063 RepID=UPI000A311AE9|nr:hypothetical protein [Oceanobacillus senegalensis]